MSSEKHQEFKKRRLKQRGKISAAKRLADNCRRDLDYKISGKEAIDDAICLKNRGFAPIRQDGIRKVHKGAYSR